MILFFDDGSEFDYKLRINLIKQKYKLIVIKLRHIHEWKFYLEQDCHQNLKGFIACPLNKFYDMHQIIGLYLNNISFSDYFDSNYEASSWYSMLSWISHTTPNNFSDLGCLKHVNHYQITHSLRQNGLTESVKPPSHLAHCIGNNVFASTISCKISILPPKVAKALTNTLNKNQICKGQFHLNYYDKKWHFCKFDINPDFDLCAFPNEFIYQAIGKHLCTNKQTKWLKFCKSIPKLKNAAPSSNYINKELLPKVTGCFYEPAC